MTVEVPLSPKVQAHEVGELVEVSENVTVSGLVPEIGDAVKFAIGVARAAVTVM